MQIDYMYNVELVSDNLNSYWVDQSQLVKVKVRALSRDFWLLAMMTNYNGKVKGEHEFYQKGKFELVV